MHKQIDAIMQKEMSRKEFLATAGFGLASIFGLSTILRLLGVSHHQSPSLHGYGSSAYGGGKK